MAYVMIDPAKIAAYHATRYRVGSDGDAITLRIGKFSQQLQRLFEATGNSCGVLITAFNPLGKMQDLETNLAAQARLKKHLQALAPIVLDAEGADPSCAWPPEPSFFALCVDQETARLLGGRYRQDAVVWVGVSAVPELLLLR